MGEAASRGDIKPLLAELASIAGNMERSRLYASLKRLHLDAGRQEPVNMAALDVPCIAEKALCYLYAEQNLLSAEQLLRVATDLGLDRDYLRKRLSDNRRPLDI
ncbi:hypothetical protein MASR2M48_24380 [Spirochaetota bacterium]